MKTNLDKNLEDSIINFINNLEKNKFEYLPVLNGVTQSGKDLNLGFSCYALKSKYILNSLENKHTSDWVQYLNNYQSKELNFQEGSFIDKKYVDCFNNQNNLKYFLKKSLNILNFGNYELKKNILEKSIRAETKQAISTIHQVNYQNRVKYRDFPRDNKNIFKFITDLNWNKPWDSGAQFSALCVFTKTQLDHDEYEANKEHLYNAISKYVDNESGAYFQGKQPSNQEVINGLMKVITGLDWIDCDMHYPKKIIDLALSINPQSEGCDIVDLVYVLYMASKKTDYKKNEIVLLFEDITNLIFHHFINEQGAFSYFLNKSQTHYYGIKITNGLNEADLHGTLLLIWALSMILNISENENLSWNIIKP
tara:strand:- start:33480 stop:34577 length:1098 start_codon:yes stop_codon:yes gene_type:complete